MINITFLILAHDMPEQLARQIDALRGASTKFVVHIDANVSIDLFLSCLSHSAGVTFLKDRHASEWGSYGIIDATLAGMRYITEHLPGTDRVVLLSGRDYPIKSVLHIESFFSANRDAIYIEYFPIPHKKWNGGGKYRFPDFEDAAESINFYGGSQWWSMPLRAVSFILDFLDFNPDLIAYFKMVTIPDESFFQTILHNCDEKFIGDNIVNSSLRIIKWDAPYLHPRIMSTDNLGLIRKSKHLFARKFDKNLYPEILDVIDEELLFLKKENIKYTDKKDLNEAVCFLSNKCDPLIIREYLTLKKTQTQSRSVHLLYHKQSGILPEIILNQAPFLFDDSILTSLGYTAMNETLIPGSNHFPLLKFYSEQPDYEYYWYIEDDVRYYGNWNDFFAYFVSSDIRSDFISSHINHFAAEPGWFWWDTIKFCGDNISDALKIRSFNPIFRISNAALKFLSGCLAQGWSGHHEVLIPTLLKKYGFVINDFGGDNPYVLPGCKNKFYSPGRKSPSGWLDSGSMRFRPFINEKEMVGTLLYHPVKLGGEKH